MTLDDIKALISKTYQENKLLVWLWALALLVLVLAVVVV